MLVLGCGSLETLASLAILHSTFWHTHRREAGLGDFISYKEVISHCPSENKTDCLKYKTTTKNPQTVLKTPNHSPLFRPNLSAVCLQDKHICQILVFFDFLNSDLSWFLYYCNLIFNANLLTSWGLSRL